MRESNYTFPQQNRATVYITPRLYDRRALDTNAPLPSLNNLTSLTYLTSTSPQIREVLTIDGGLERLLDILRDSTLPRPPPVATPDIWGLNGPPSARDISLEQQIAVRHSLAFQCVVNIGVRGTEAIRTRVVQAGALDLVAQMLESWLIAKGVYIHASALGSQAAVNAEAQGRPYGERKKAKSSGHRRRQPEEEVALPQSLQQQHQLFGHASAQPPQMQFEARPILRSEPLQTVPLMAPQPVPATDEVEMEDAQMTPPARPATGEGERPQIEERPALASSLDSSGSVLRDAIQVREVPNAPNPSAITPRARQGQLPMAIPIPVHADYRSDSRVSSAGNSYSGVEDEFPRASSSASGSSTTEVLLDREMNETVVPGPSRRRTHERIPQLVETDGPVSNQSSPMGTPTRLVPERLRRETVTGRPPGLFPRRERMPTGGSGTSAGEEAEEPRPAETPEAVAIVQDLEPQTIEEPDADALAAAQTAQDLFDGAPPGQPGTGVNDVLQAATPRVVPGPIAQAQIITATGAPRGFPDLASFLTQRLDEPDAEHEYGDSTVLVALQLLAYLSKYPHVRSVFYDPHRPMHPTFNYDRHRDERVRLPQRPASSQTNNIFCLVERFRFRPNPQDPVMCVIPQEIQYWAGVIMRNACRKDEKRGGLRQCANMSCGRWELSPREFAKCRRCRKAKYCSKECQSQAWAEGHRFWCDAKNEEALMHGSAEIPTPGFATPESRRRPRHDEAEDVEMEAPQAAAQPRRSVWAQARNLITGGEPPR